MARGLLSVTKGGAKGLAAGQRELGRRLSPFRRSRRRGFAGPDEIRVSIGLNGNTVQVLAAPRLTLLDLLRNSLGLVGTKKSCDEGTCGACTVLIDGRAVYACMTLAVLCDGRTVETIESLSSGGQLDPVQRALIEHDAVQCGFCTPGQVMALVGLLRESPTISEADVRRAVTGNLCRCGTYPNIVAAGLAASRSK